ncbi:MAG: isochorismatase family cysteine hydrolase [Nanoarchaeota archaeon]
MKKALILIDLENEYINKHSDYFVGDVSDLFNKINKLLEYCRKENYKIVFIRHVEKDSEDCFKENTINTEIIKDINKKDSDVVITKHKISSFYQTNLEKELKNIGEMIVCGILTNLCVRSLIEEAYDREFQIKVIKDCCKAFDDETQEFTFKDLKSTREEIEFLDLEELISD